MDGDASAVTGGRRPEFMQFAIHASRLCYGWIQWNIRVSDQERQRRDHKYFYLAVLGWGFNIWPGRASLKPVCFRSQSANRGNFAAENRFDLGGLDRELAAHARRTFTWAHDSRLRRQLPIRRRSGLESNSGVLSRRERLAFTGRERSGRFHPYGSGLGFKRISVRPGAQFLSYLCFQRQFRFVDPGLLILRAGMLAIPGR